MKRALVLLTVVLASAAAEARSRAVRGSDPGPAAWLRANAHALTTVEPTADDSDLAPLLPIVAQARIIALGDATHGTHEFFSIKQRLIPWLVKHANVRTLVFEAPYAEFERIHRGGDAAEALRSDDYFFWDSQEVLDTIEWARANGVEVVGIDPFHPHTTMDLVIDGVRRTDAAMATEIEKRYSCLDAYAASPLHYGTTAQWYRDSCRASIASVRPMLADDDLAHAARIVEQGEQSLSSGPANAMSNRDAAMAENLEWLLARTSGNIAVWGHNEHFGRTPFTLYDHRGTPSTGSILTAKLGGAYVSIGTVALRGTFHAAEFIGAVGHISPFPLATASRDDWATLFAEAAMPQMIVPLRGSLPTWLLQPHAMRIAGSNILSRQQPTVELMETFAGKFDAVIYVETSTPSRLRNLPVIGD